MAIVVGPARHPGRAQRRNMEKIWRWLLQLQLWQQPRLPIGLVQKAPW
jgi:hypothetical protein